MCGRYYIDPNSGYINLSDLIADIRQRYNDLLEGANLKLGEIHPTDNAPVIANSRRLKPQPFLMKWGFNLPGGKRPVINARSETAGDKSLFKKH